MPRYRLNLLGGFGLISPTGENIEIPSQKGRFLLAYLALNGDRAIGRDALSVLLWEDSEAHSARTNLRQVLSRIRKALPDADGDLLRASDDAIALNGDRVTVDVRQFEARVAEATNASLQTAVELYRGAFLAGMVSGGHRSEDWLDGCRAQLQEVVCDGLQRLSEAALVTGDLNGAVRHARGLLTLDPVREDAHRLLMRAFVEQGRAASALRQYQQCADILDRELGVTPETETVELHKSIRLHRRYGAASEKGADIEPTKIVTEKSIARDRVPAASPMTLVRAVKTLFAGMRPYRSAPIAAAGVFAVLTAAGPAWWQTDAPELVKVRSEGPIEVTASRPTVAVLPFENFTGDEMQAFFADGVTDTLISGLSKVSGLSVLPRSSVLAYKGRAVTTQQVARETGARYVLHGGVHRVGATVRFHSKLFDARTSRLVWSDNFDGPLSKIFTLQDKVAAKTIQGLAAQVWPSGSIAFDRQDTVNPAAHDAFVRGWPLYLLGTPSSYRQARDLFKRAVTLDPNYSRAHAALASVYTRVYSLSWGMQTGLGSSKHVAQKARIHLKKAMLRPTPLALILRARQLRIAHEHAAAVAEAHRARALDPKDPEGSLGLGLEFIFEGDPSAAIPLIEDAMRLDPANRWRYAFALGLAHLTLDRPREAAVALTMGLEGNPDSYDLWYLMAAAKGSLGDVVAANHAVKRVTDLKRAHAMHNVRGTIHEMDYWGFKRRADIERIAVGLRRAGVPDS